MRAFDINEYNRIERETGKKPKLITRQGLPARIFCTDLKDSDYPIAGAYTLPNGYEEVNIFTPYGSVWEETKDDNDLFFE